MVVALDEEGEDRLAPRVLLELLAVVPVLAEGPDCHLVGAGQGEEEGGQALRHDGEGDPGADLVGVVGAGDEVEEGRQRVGVGEGDLAHLGAGRAQVALQDVDREVADLAELEDRERDLIEIIRMRLIHMQTSMSPQRRLSKNSMDSRR